MNKVPQNKYAANLPWKRLTWLMDFVICGLVIHWIFQGILYMDRSEKLFKVLLDFLLTVGIGFLLISWFPWIFAIPFAFLIAHTLNFLFNGQLWVLMKIYGRVDQNYSEFATYFMELSRRIKAEKSVGFAAVYGSQVRGEWKPTSDLDVRLVRKAGIFNAFRSCIFVTMERTRALFHKFPLDIYILDSFTPLMRMRGDEIPLIICDFIDYSNQKLIQKE